MSRPNDDAKKRTEGGLVSQQVAQFALIFANMRPVEQDAVAKVIQELNYVRDTGFGEIQIHFRGDRIIVKASKSHLVKK